RRYSRPARALSSSPESLPALFPARRRAFFGRESAAAPSSPPVAKSLFADERRPAWESSLPEIRKRLFSPALASGQLRPEPRNRPHLAQMFAPHASSRSPALLHLRMSREYISFRL